MTEIDKIIRTLDLTQSDAREETLAGIIKFIIYSSEVEIPIKDVSGFVKKEFSIQVHQSEINECIDKLIDKKLVEKNIDKIKLSQEEFLKIKQQNLENNENKNARFLNFSRHIQEIATQNDYPIVEAEIDTLWSLFLNYLYESYLSHGKNAILNFTNEEVSNDDEINILIKKSTKSLSDNKNLEKIFIEYVKKFPSYIDSQLLTYLTELANKTEAFYALGLSKEEYNRIYQDIKFDWIIFVDTNFLYSILNLHSHPEDEAAKAVLTLGKTLGIKFKYIPKTYEELNNKKKDFDSYLERNLEISQVRALLMSNKLDNFAKNYYEKKLNDPTNTPHPTDIISHSQAVLKSHGLEIYQSKFDVMDKMKDYLLDQESKFSDYLSMLDEYRGQKGLKMKGKKDPYQVEHDIFLREAILFLRKKNVTSLNEARYFGATLDKTLIKYDHYEILRKAYSSVIPTFFKPSLLLKKLLKYSPVDTEDYLRAFVSTISTPALDDNYSTSKPAIRSVRYFHKMGINDEKLIFDCLKEEMFLTNFEAKENDEQALGVFIESEINKKISESSKHIVELKKIQKQKEEEISKVKDVSLSTNQNKIKLEKRLYEMESSLKLYERELKKVVSKPKYQTQFDFKQLTIEDEAEKIGEENVVRKIENKNEKLRNEIVKTKAFYWIVVGYLSIIPVIFIIVFYSLIVFFQNEDWNFVGNYFKTFKDLSEIQNKVWDIILAIPAAILSFLFMKIFIKRIFEKKALENYKKETLEKLD